MLFIGYPLWWLLGLTEGALLACAALLALELVQQRRLAFPRGFGLWALFLVWSLIGVFVVQVAAPGGVDDRGGTRYLTWALRLLTYLAGTVIILYIGNSRSEFPTPRVMSVFGWMFVWIVLGGTLIFVAPGLTFPSLLESALPRRISSIPFVLSLVHPSVVETQNYLGVITLRPSAPFSFANEWGVNYICFLPFFVYSWCVKARGLRRVVGISLLAVSVVPVIYSLNRALWAALLLAAVFLAVRSAAAGHLKMIGALLVALVIVGGAVMTPPFSTTLQQRFTAHDSNEGRASLAGLTLESVASTSPVIGFGTTRKYQGAFNSISLGSTSECPHCTPPPLGTQGQLWSAVFTTGIGGLAFFLSFFLLMIWRHLRLYSLEVNASLLVLLSFIATLPFYDLSGPALFAVMAAAAVLWREELRLKSTKTPTGHPLVMIGDSTAGRSIGGHNQRLALLLVCSFLGLGAGAAWGETNGTTARATISVQLPSERTFSSLPPTTLDTVAELLASPKVKAAVEDAGGSSNDDGTSQLEVTAVPNSRILTLTYVGETRSIAENVVSAGARALIDVREGLLLADRRSGVSQINAHRDGLAAALGAFHEADRALLYAPSYAVRSAPQGVLARSRYSLLAEYNGAQSEAADVSSTTNRPATLAGPANSVPIHDGGRIALGTGLGTGCLAGVILIWWVGARRRHGHQTSLNRRQAGRHRGLRHQ